MTLRIAFVPGVTITKWTRTWAERHPSRPLEILPISEQEQLTVIAEGRVDVCFARLPIISDDLSVIRLYSEIPVAVLGREHPFGDAAELESAALADDTLLSVTDLAASGAGTDDDPTKHAVELVAAGIGVLVLPHSVARLYNRKDVRAVPLTDGTATEIALVWKAEGTTDDIDDWIGIVRGRTTASSRGRETDAGAAAIEKKALAKKESAAKSQAKMAQEKKNSAAAKGRRHAGQAGRSSSKRPHRKKR